MNRKDLEEARNKLMELFVDRRRLGGFDANASTILILTENLLKVIQHLEERTPRQKSDVDKN